jgi:molecular chaperone GrpE
MRVVDTKSRFLRFQKKEDQMIKPQAQTDEENALESERSGEQSPEANTQASVSDPVASRVAELEKQLAEMKDRALREMADAENTRRRAQKEREETSKYAVGNFAKEMLGVADNFSRALAAAPSETSDPTVANLIAGVQATDRMLQSALDRFGIRKIEPVGEMFDPHFHQVMMEVDAPDQTPGTIVQVLQAGYVIHDRLLREALVAVAKGKSGDGKPSVSHIDTSA